LKDISAAANDFDLSYANFKALHEEIEMTTSQLNAKLICCDAIEIDSCDLIKRQELVVISS